jgi:hypothetical protein
VLNPEETVVLIGAQGVRRMLMGFHPEPGNYEIIVPPGTVIEPGSRWDFFCPVCQKSLVTAENENLCALDLIEGETRHQVLFSRVAGEHATLVVADQRLAGEHGEHAATYVHHFVQTKHLD